MSDKPEQWKRNELLKLSDAEKVKRFDAMIKACFWKFNDTEYKDNLAILYPRKTLDIKRRIDGVETWFEGDWLSNLYMAREGKRG